MSKNIFFRSILSIFLIISISLGNVNIALADDSTPPTATAEPTEEPTQPVDEPTATTGEIPSSEEQVPAVDEASTPSLFSQVPEDTTIVVLDESGNSVPLVSQDGLDAILEDDPMWCPGTTPPGGIGCINFTGPTGITDLLTDMRDNTDLYDANGTIYFTVNPGNGSFTLTDDDLSLDTDFSTLANFNLILQGGWNGSTLNPQYTQTNFGSNSITIGTSSNPWGGNITLNNFTFSGGSSTTAVTVYTTSGDITLSNVDVSQQTGGTNTANLVSSSGDITVQNGSTFDGDNQGNGDTSQGFNASTTTGTITITGTAADPITFTDAEGNGTGTNYNGATLSAPTVTLTNVTATGNDLNGIYITNASTVTLNNVISGNNNNGGNGTNPNGPNNSVGSGVYVQGPAGGTNVFVNGGYFANNERYGIEITNGSITTVGTAPTYGTGGNANGLGNLSVNTAPVLTVPANITVEATGSTGAVVSFTVTATDTEDNPDPTPACNRTSGSVFAIGTTTVNCTVTDSGGVTTANSFTVTVQDTTGPALTVPANITQEATGPTGRVVTYTANATDLVDGPRTISCAPISGSTFTISTTTVNCSSTDTRGNTSNGSFTITIQDTTPPTIAAHVNVTAEATSASGAAVTYISPSTTDIVDVTGTANCAPASGSTFALGNTTVTCNATDLHGNAATPTTFTVTVQDTTAPILILPADMTVEATGLTGATVSYSSSASDLVDASVLVGCSPVSGSTFPFGTTTVNCAAADDYNNIANGSFTVTVQDTTPPAIAAQVDVTAEATSATGAIVTYTNPSTTDIVDGAGVATCAPASGSNFALGNTIVTCNATDKLGNAATPTTFTVTVQDTTVPTLTLPANMTVEATGSTGAIVTYFASASDLVDASVPVSCSSVSGSTFPIGTTTVNCSATDDYNNNTNGSFTVTVQDTTSPVIAQPANIIFVTNNSSKKDVLFYTPPTTTDIVDGTGSATCTPASGSVFNVGNTTVTCTAVDSHGNAAEPVTFTVTLNYIEPVNPGTGGGTSTLIPITGGETIALDCNTQVMMLGIKVTFYNLCERQAILTSVDANSLPGNLPAGFTFVAGLNVTVLNQSQLLEPLPAGAGIEMDFPVKGTNEQFVVLFWSNGKWVEVTQQLKEADLARALNNDVSNELYKITSSGNGVYKALTTENTGTFILVKK